MLLQCLLQSYFKVTLKWFQSLLSDEKYAWFLFHNLNHILFLSTSRKNKGQNTVRNVGKHMENFWFVMDFYAAYIHVSKNLQIGTTHNFTKFSIFVSSVL